MGFGEILDRTFQIYRRNFSKVFLLMLVLIAPVYLLQNLLTTMFGAPMVPDYQQIGSFEDYLTTMEAAPVAEPTMGIGGIIASLLVAFVVVPILYVVLYPLAASSTLYMVESGLKNQDISFGQMLKKPFRKFWLIVANSLLFAVIIFGISIGVIIVIAMTTLFGVGFSVGFENVVVGILAGIMIIGMVLLSIFIYGFFSLRCGFFLPPILFENKGVGIDRSWKLTKKNFWRLFGILLLIFIIYIVLTEGATLIFGFFLGASVLGQVLQTIVIMLTMPILFIIYALIYFDLVTRKEGVDLEHMLDDTDEGNPGDHV
ncbi:hypothetical protein HUG15_19705 [Salicibibacter cibarius]|uniref:Glycerophosphoryl diester phosphodiesterase membrane domain-containing protein n=2 Tax=Salicibibacter cibarius TaxID=2743000 RepID=A0A7T6Z689_9BACI|nr:hypothetical protein HUG15_19705 [Salicibibacter cibarius]